MARFNDGATGTIDLSAELWGPMFEPLKDKTLFGQADDTPGARNRDVAQWRGPCARSSCMNKQFNRVRPQTSQKLPAVEREHPSQSTTTLGRFARSLGHVIARVTFQTTTAI